MDKTKLRLAIGNYILINVIHELDSDLKHELDYLTNEISNLEVKYDKRELTDNEWEIVKNIAEEANTTLIEIADE